MPMTPPRYGRGKGPPGGTDTGGYRFTRTIGPGVAGSLPRRPGSGVASDAVEDAAVEEVIALGEQVRLGLAHMEVHPVQLQGPLGQPARHRLVRPQVLQLLDDIGQAQL